MKLTSPRLEKAVLLALLEARDKKVYAYLLKNTEVADFGLEWAQDVRERIDYLMRLGKPVGRTTDLAQDPALSAEAQKWILSKASTRRAAQHLSLERVEYMIRILQTRRKMRALSDGLVAITKVAEGKVIGDRQMDSIERRLEVITKEIRRGEDREDFTHFGLRADVNEIKQIIRETTHPSGRRFISTGLDALDRHMRGFEPGDLVTLSCPRGGGKTLVASAMAINQYRQHKHNVAIFSLEMTRHHVVQRMIANLSGISNTVLRDPDRMNKGHHRKIIKAMQDFIRWGKKNRCEFSVRDVKAAGYTPHMLVAELAPYEFDVVYVDYITLFDTKGQSVWEMQKEYSRYLALEAKNLGCVMVILTQLNEDERVKYGKAIEENTDYWFWWNWDAESRARGETKLILDKARHAEGGVSFFTKFNFAQMNIDVAPRSRIGQDEASAQLVAKETPFDSVGAF